MLCKLCNPNNNFDVIYKATDYYLVFDNYGLHYGHLLLIPSKHVLNISQASININTVFAIIVNALKDYYHQKICIYEHGNITENLTQNISIDHAHLHLLPLNNGIEKIENIISTEATIIRTDFREFYSNPHSLPYHFVSLNGLYSFYTYDTLMSQAFRKAYAISEDVEKWNWKIDGEEIIRVNSEKKSPRQHLKDYLTRRLNYAGIE